MGGSNTHYMSKVDRDTTLIGIIVLIFTFGMIAWTKTLSSVFLLVGVLSAFAGRVFSRDEFSSTLKNIIEKFKSK